MNTWTLTKRITLGFAGLLLLFASLSIASYVWLKQIRVRQHEISAHVLPGLSVATDLKDNAALIELYTLRHEGTRVPEAQARWEKEIAGVAARSQELLAAAEPRGGTLEERAALARIRTAQEAYARAQKPVLELSRVSLSDVDLELEIAKTALAPAYTELRTACESFFKDQTQQGQTHVHGSEKTIDQAIQLTLTFAGLAILCGAGISFGLIRSLGKLLGRVAQDLGAGSRQIALATEQTAAASQSLASSATEQAASLEETSASLEEMTSMTKRTAANAQAAKELGNATRTAADTGTTDIQSMSLAMDEIKVSSDNIAKIIKTIDEIAFQTNLLALNAAVEAARAGEAGAGFAVVADEVRSLAQRSATAAKETAAKIEDSIQKSERGVQISARVSHSLGEIVAKARQMDELINEIAGATAEQSQGIGQVNLAITQLDQGSQSAAASSTQLASASASLRRQTASLHHSVHSLETLVGTSSASPDFTSGSTHPNPHAARPKSQPEAAPTAAAWADC